MDWGLAAQWAGVALASAAIVVSVWAKLSAGRRHDDRELEDRLGRMRREISKLYERQGIAEHQLAHMPPPGEFQAMAARFDTLVARLDGLGQLVERQEKVTTRLEDYVRDISRERKA